MELDTFTRAYLVAALWASTDEHGEPLDAVFTVDDISPLAINRAIEDCADFREQCGALLDGMSDESAGYDFWLTRNGHGAGFWDRGLGEQGERLSDIAKHMGSCDIYPADDGKLYFA